MYNSKCLNNIRMIEFFFIYIMQHLTSKLGPKLGTKEIIFYIVLE